MTYLNLMGVGMVEEKKKRGGKDGDDKMEKRAKGVTADQPAKD